MNIESTSNVKITHITHTSEYLQINAFQSLGKIPQNYQRSQMT